MKAKALAEHLAENPVDDNYEPLSTYFPDEEVNSIEEVVLDDSHVWKMYFDGAVNIKGVGTGAIHMSPIGQHYPIMARLQFFCTNNTTEYMTCIMGLKMALDLDVHELLVMGDFDLLIQQAQGEWETQDMKLIPYRQSLMLPYPRNTHIDPLEIQVRNQHGYCNAIEVEPYGEPWYHYIKRFLKMREYSEHAKRDQKITIRWLTGGFFLNEEIMYKRTPDLNVLRCIDSTEAERIMSEVHSGVCGPYMNGYVLAKKILRAGFILVAIDYFAKWVEAITFKAITKKAVVDFVHPNIICRFSIPKTIITNNAANLNSHLMKEVCKQFKIVHHHSIPCHLKANRAIEAANKNNEKILRKMIDKWGF
ncbi:uncharacterized protein [Nicotiana tomentosiformis]|uniref:uncharacterized protein n=1 Tax=Nicotiana tomentosiformis TaxID=4098 RepID=UPI00388C8215